MIKTIEFIIVMVLLAFSFFAGVKYSTAVKESANWLFEAKEEEEEIDIPDLSKAQAVELNSSVEDNY